MTVKQLFDACLQKKKEGMNPEQIIDGVVQKHPEMKRGLPYIKGKNEDQLRQTFFNLCNEFGLNPLFCFRQTGIQFPK